MVEVLFGTIWNSPVGLQILCFLPKKEYEKHFCFAASSQGTVESRNDEHVWYTPILKYYLVVYLDVGYFFAGHQLNQAT